MRPAAECGRRTDGGERREMKWVQVQEWRDWEAGTAGDDESGTRVRKRGKHNMRRRGDMHFGSAAIGEHKEMVKKSNASSVHADLEAKNAAMCVRMSGRRQRYVRRDGGGRCTRHLVAKSR
jgi:hypothetical protein